MFFLRKRRKPGPDSPNVLVIITDQHNVRSIGCYGNEEVATPQLDRLAGQSVVFDNAITPSGACRPAKMSILTGMHPRTHGLFDGKAGTPKGWTTLAQAFKRGGYRTALFGKHHMHSAVKGFGFDRLSPGPNPNEGGPDDGSFVGVNSKSNERHSTGVIASETIEFLERNQRRPFFLMMSQFAPHTPIFPSEPWASQYDPSHLTLPANRDLPDPQAPEAVRQLRLRTAKRFPGPQDRTLAHYYGLVSQVDYNIGRVLDRMEELELLDNTIVLFLSDHGEMMGEFGCWTKETVGYDAVVRIPLIVRLPGGTNGGQRRKQLASSLDVMPTLLDLAGIKPPHPMEGVSLRGVLEDGSKEGAPFAVSELFGVHNSSLCSTVRTERWKYFRTISANAPTEEFLFDLEADPWEMNDLSGAPEGADMLAQCRKWLDGWQSENALSQTARGQMQAAGLDVSAAS